jgi:predicted RecB family nuclease
MEALATPVRIISAKGGYFDSTCARKVHLEHDSSYAGAELDHIPAADQARMDSGHLYEAHVAWQWSAEVNFTDADDTMLEIAGDAALEQADKVAALVALLGSVDAFAVPSCDRTAESKARREVLTLAALAAGVPLVWNARLAVMSTRVSEPDFLVRAGDAPKPNGLWAYRPGDVKDARVFAGTSSPSRYPVSTFDSFSYETARRRVIDEGLPKLKHSRQLAHYHEHLAEFGHQATGAKLWGCILGREGVLVWRDLNEAAYSYTDRSTGTKRKMSPLEIYRQEFSWRLDVAHSAADPDTTALAGPELKAECGSCPWRTVCHDELEEMDHITLLPGVTPERAQVHYAAGVTTRSQLARFHWVTAKTLDAGVDVAALLANAGGADPSDPAETLLPGRAGRAALVKAGLVTVGDVSALDQVTAAAYAGLKVSRLADAVDAARVAKAGKVHLARGVAKLDVPRADIELDVDMENDPAGVIYLWGTRLVVRHDGLRIPGPAYRPFATWTELDDDGEAAAFAGLWAWMQALITLAATSGLTFKAYCYTGAEARCFRHLVAKHAGVRGVPTAEELEEFLASAEWVDLYPIVAGDMVWPTEDLSLKSTAKWARFSWRDSDASGDSSTVWYRQAVSAADPAEREAAQRRLLEYNEDDVTATLVLRDWLSRLASARQPGERLPGVKSLESRFARRPRRTRAA